MAENRLIPAPPHAPTSPQLTIKFSLFCYASAEQSRHDHAARVVPLRKFISRPGHVPGVEQDKHGRTFESAAAAVEAEVYEGVVFSLGQRSVNGRIYGVLCSSEVHYKLDICLVLCPH